MCHTCVGKGLQTRCELVTLVTVLLSRCGGVEKHRFRTEKSSRPIAGAVVSAFSSSDSSPSCQPATHSVVSPKSVEQMLNQPAAKLR